MLAFSLLGLWLIFGGFVLGDADFSSVRTSLHKDHTTFDRDPKKYFHEASFHYHYDGRFAENRLTIPNRLPYLTAMVKAYLSLMADIGVETWILHGTLLGWWWNQKVMPWDTDLDVQVSEASMHFLAKYYNMTEHTFRVPEALELAPRTYLLEINPNFVTRSFHDKENAIDARWIDTASGLFIDITSVGKDEFVDALMSKDRYRYSERDLFPLRHSRFEGMPVKIPYAYHKLLVEEYGNDALTRTFFNDHEFDQETKIWEYMPPWKQYMREQRARQKKSKEEPAK